MLIPNQIIEVAWMPTNKDYYQKLGYVFTKCRDTFHVKAEDLCPCSHKIVKVQCDYCGDIVEKKYVRYIKGQKTGKDCCVKCNELKVKDSFLRRYGVENPFYLDEIKEKIKITNLARYGVENPFESEEIKEKIQQNNLDKYGVAYNSQRPEIISKIKQTNLERYGVEYVFQSPVIKEKIRQTNLEKYGYDGNIAQAPVIQAKIQQTNLKKYGVRYSTQSPEVIAKMRESLYKNGNVPSSSIERYICDMLHQIYGSENCLDGFAIGNVNLDCLLLVGDDKIDIEYDGWYWHKNRQEKDKRRNYWLIGQGYRILRIRSNNEIPTKEQIMNGVDYLVKGNHHLCYIDLDIQDEDII